MRVLGSAFRVQRLTRKTEVSELLPCVATLNPEP